MATIYKRKTNAGYWRYRVQIRYKGLPKFNYTFATAKAACEWVDKNERDYLKNPEKYITWAGENRLRDKRLRLLDD